MRRDIFSPAKVVVFVWCLAIGLAALKLSHLQHEWSSEEWIKILIGPISFLCGVYIVSVSKIGKPLQHLEGIRDGWRGREADRRKLYYLNLVLFFLFIVGYASIYLSGKEIPLFSLRSGEARLQFEMFGLGMFLHNVVFIVYSTVVYCTLEHQISSKGWILILLSLITLILYTLTLQRFQVMMALGLSILFLHYTTRILRFYRVVIFLMLCVVFFYFISTIRGGQFYIAYLYLTSQMKFSSQYAIFTEPYMYFVMNIENFGRAIGHLDQFTYGYYTFDFVTAITGLKHWLGEYFSLVETPFLVSGYNTYSAFWTYYRDFGVLGLLIFPFVLGIVSSTLYFRMIHRPSLTSISIYSVCVFTIIFSFFHNLISFLWYEYNLIGLYVMLRFIRARHVESDGSRGIVYT